jgi:hypothetical protein
MAIAAAVVLAWGAAVAAGLQPLMLDSLAWPWAVRAALVLALVAPVSVALGVPFPLGLGAVTDNGASPALLPWAWGLNGAFSVLSTPLANLVAREDGFSRVLLGGTMLYVLAAVTFPSARKSVQWQDLPARSHAAD